MLTIMKVNLFYSLFSYTSKELSNEIVKLASTIEDESEGKKFLDGLKNKLSILEKNKDEGMVALQNYVQRYVDELEEQNDDQ